jgi:hypothetical protein
MLTPKLTFAEAKAARATMMAEVFILIFTGRRQEFVRLKRRRIKEF